MLADQRVVDRSLAVARAAADHVVVVLAPGDEDLGAGMVASGAADIAVTGGDQRADSVRAGLAVVDADAAVIVVHDVARPLASAELHRAVVEAVRRGADAVIPGVPVTDTIKRVHHDERGRTVVDTPDRSSLIAVQTPQAFRAAMLRAAHASGADATDDAALVEAVGGTVVVVDGERTNLKITSPDDLAIAHVLLGGLG